ncbi:MAG TPA: S4 domain-containing protein [bacterium]
MNEQLENDKKIRLDKWLKIARIYKTRELAIRACDDGKVKVNDQKAKPSRTIASGDKVTIKSQSKYRTFEVLEIVRKNVSTKDARLLYSEQAPQLSEKAKELYEILQEIDKQGRRKYKGRPTKKERRQMDKMKGS